MKTIKWIILLFSFTLQAQECNPYYTIPKYELSKKKSGGIGYVACLHAKGVVAEVGYNNTFVGVLAMGQGHHGAAYTFLQYEYITRKLRIYGGPAYRLNHNPALLIGRMGTDYQLYKNLYSTFSILQVNTNLNYVHIGLKLII